MNFVDITRERGKFKNKQKKNSAMERKSNVQEKKKSENHSFSLAYPVVVVAVRHKGNDAEVVKFVLWLYYVQFSIEIQQRI